MAVEQRLKRLTDRIANDIEKGNFYDAQQSVRTVYPRVKRTDPARAQSMLAEYAIKFAEKDQPELASDLATLLVEHFAATDQAPNDENLNAFLKVFEAIPLESEHRNSAIESALKWTTTSEAQGSAQLHRAYGETLTARGLYARAILHLVYCQDAKAIWSALRPWIKQGYLSEEPYFVFRVVLMLLALNDVSTARKVLAEYDRDNCHVLIEFACLITESCACGSEGFMFYQHVRSKYQLLLRKDTSWGVEEF